jgi:predicted hotdog family 3-hydroxylacyl-ACP dehydratase
MLDRGWILAHIPHQGDMCLIENVTTWSAEALRCTASSHRLPSNPLRRDGRLGAACAIEYAAQAMAIHGALQGSSGQQARPGFLVSVRAVDLHVDRLDDILADLDIEVSQLVADDERVLYQFRVSTAEVTLCAGRAAVLLMAPP